MACRIDRTELRVSPWSFGTASLHHLATRGERQRLLHAARDAGFTHFDASPYYGEGLAECELAGLLRSGRDRVTIATKVGLYPRHGRAGGSAGLWLRKGVQRLAGRSGPLADWSVATARASLDASLRRMGTDHADLVFLHEPDPARVDADAFLRWLEDERSAGRVRYWGLAGDCGPMRDWIAADHPLAQVLQVRDSLERRQSDPLQDAGRAPQFRFGYFAGLADGAPTPAAWQARLAAIRARNPGGSVIVSTRRLARLAAFHAVAEAA
jgi:aryl-alcohol dehydrogenase-like predicted oxidoreductase